MTTRNKTKVHPVVKLALDVSSLFGPHISNITIETVEDRFGDIDCIALVFEVGHYNKLFIEANVVKSVKSELKFFGERLHKILDARSKKVTTTDNMETLRDVVQGAMAIVNAMAQAEAQDDFMALKPECIKLNDLYDKLPEINKLLNTKQG